MEFLIGFILGCAVTLGSGYVYTFKKKTDEKDDAIVTDMGKKFEDKIRLVPKDK